MRHDNDVCVFLRCFPSVLLSMQTHRMFIITWMLLKWVVIEVPDPHQTSWKVRQEDRHISTYNCGTFSLRYVSKDSDSCLCYFCLFMSHCFVHFLLHFSLFIWVSYLCSYQTIRPTCPRYTVGLIHSHWFSSPILSLWYYLQRRISAGAKFHPFLPLTPRFHQIHVCFVIALIAPVLLCSPSTPSGCALSPPRHSTVNNWRPQF